MKKSEPVQIGDLIRNAIEMAGCTETYGAYRVCYLWPEAVGPTINRFTVARWIRKDELHVSITSASIKNELSFMSEAIIARLNELAGTKDNPVVRRLVIH